MGRLVLEESGSTWPESTWPALYVYMYVCIYLSIALKCLSIALTCFAQTIIAGAFD